MSRKNSAKDNANAIEEGETIEELRRSILRKINTLEGLARTCRDKACRRAKECVGAHLLCLRDNPLPPVSKEDAARRLAYVRRLLAKRMAELEAQSAHEKGRALARPS